LIAATMDGPMGRQREQTDRQALSWRAFALPWTELPTGYGSWWGHQQQTNSGLSLATSEFIMSNLRTLIMAWQVPAKNYASMMQILRQPFDTTK